MMCFKCRHNNYRLIIHTCNIFIFNRSNIKDTNVVGDLVAAVVGILSVVDDDSLMFMYLPLIIDKQVISNGKWTNISLLNFMISIYKYAYVHK